MAASSPYRYYLDIISNWPTAIALESQWFSFIDIGTVGALKDASNSIPLYDTAGTNGSNNLWNIPQATIDYLNNSTNQGTINDNNHIGCSFCREVTIPGETINAANKGLNYGGYQAPATSDGRKEYGKVHLVFTETHSSFLDFVIRPWIIAVGYFGLIARPNNSPKNVKANYMDVCYLGKNGPYKPSVVRKIVRFFNVAPISIGSMTNTYASEGMQYKGVDFVYDAYGVLDPTGGTLLKSSSETPSKNTSPKSTQSLIGLNQQSFSSATSFGEKTTLTFPSGTQFTTQYGATYNPFTGLPTIAGSESVVKPIPTIGPLKGD